ncbi:MAG: DUF1576 domain-containing protein [Peptostreptococcaceae bacterium]|nr:DUF1576 domain-containing protein [Peptostreptococcaceae bacterium]
MKKRKLIFYYIWLITFFSFFVISGFFLQPPGELATGLYAIIRDSSVLLTDYLAIGGIGASFVNAGLLGLVCVAILLLLDMKPNGSIILSLFLVFGFGFFGKNLLNVWPVIGGVYLYSRKKKHPFRNYIIIAFMSTSLAPAVNQIFLLVTDAVLMSFLLSTLGGILLGFLMPSLVSHCLKMHEGFMLANAGFASGFIAISFVALFKSFGFDMTTKNVWSSEYTVQLAVILFIVFGAMVFTGAILNKEPISTLGELMQESGRIVTDFFILYGNFIPLINMGLVGIFYTILTLLLTGQINGPFVAGIFTVVGFAGFGLNLRNVIPVTVGSYLAAKLNIISYDVNNLMLIILFGTSLAPFSGYFGIIWGIIAGFVHLCLTLNVGVINAGINLYNNGFVAGLVVILLLPIASSLREESDGN